MSEETSKARKSTGAQQARAKSDPDNANDVPAALEDQDESESKKRGGNRKKKEGEDREPAPRVVVRPMAGPAKRKKRHYGIVVGFFLLVILPWSAIIWYVEGRAVDRYASTVGFTVRQEDGAQGSAILGGLEQFAGASAASGAGDSDILYEYIRSQRLVSRIDERLDLWTHFTEFYDQDPVFALKPGGTIEDLHAYWGKMVIVDYDSATGLIGLEVRAFDPDFAQNIANEILVESQTLVNELNQAARQDLLKNAQQDVADSLVRVKAAREALIKFRTRTQIVDPESDMRTRMGVQNSLQQQLAEALIEYDLIVQTAGPNDPRVVNAKRKIEVIRARLAEERSSFAAAQSEDGVEGYPTLIAEYESLAIDNEYAEQTYRSALVQLDGAQMNATRQSRYLAAYIQPTMPETATYPKRTQTILIGLLFLVLAWALVTLVFYSLRDRS